jgi:multidrug efflux pump subunit AcrB
MISWFARNHVAATLLMVGIALAGIATLGSNRIPLEVFPDFPDRTIIVNVPYPGATPAETEETIVQRVEDAIQQVPGIARILSTAGSSGGTVNIEVNPSSDAREVLADVKNRIDAIATFPRDSEKPIVSIPGSFNSVITVIVAADLAEKDLARLGETIRDDILSLPGISHAELNGVRPYEIAIEIPEANLRRHGLTLDNVSQAITNSALDLPAGLVRTESGDISIKTTGRAYTADDYAALPVFIRPDGSKLLLSDVATITDDFNENPLEVRFNGRRCVSITVTREGLQNAVQIAQQIKDFVETTKSKLPAGVDISYWNDRSKIVKGRIDLMINNGIQSFLLVFLALFLFLRLDVAFWVSLGIPVAFLGAFATMPWLGVTINSSSLFGFIMVLGVVVDDAIVVSESIVRKIQEGVPIEQAAVSGTKQVSTPVLFGIATNIIAFIPLTLGLGDWGPMFQPIAMVVIPVMLFSVIESQLCLPAHLSAGFLRRPAQFFLPVQNAANRVLNAIMRISYRPLLKLAVTHRYLSAAVFLGSILLLSGYVLGGRINWMPFPRVPSERIYARLTMLEGTPIEVTEAHINRMYDIAKEMEQDYMDPEGRSVFKHMLTVVGGTGFTSTYKRGATGRPNEGEVSIETYGPEERSMDISTVEIANEWRKRIGSIIGAEELTFRAEIFRGGDPIDIQLIGNNPNQLLRLSAKIKDKLNGYPGIFDVNDSLDQGRSEIQFKIKPEAQQYGITTADLARQVRQAFYGDEIQRIQRGREEVRVFVRYPKNERTTLATLETMRVRNSTGIELPLATVATLEVGKSFTSIRRVNRSRALNITADVDKGNVDLTTIKAELRTFIDDLLRDQTGVKWSFEGEDKATREAGNATLWGGILVLLGLYTMLAIPFHSYTQPFIVLLVIPFGVVGAIIGHLYHGLPLSMLSIFGILALSGVIINDSIVMVDFINRARAAGSSTIDAVLSAGPKRFRPILLTSITTFVGLMPLIYEKATTAQFLIPMAVSLGYGILFGTIITLFLVPISYAILSDFTEFRHPAKASETPDTPPPAPPLSPQPESAIIPT